MKQSDIEFLTEMGERLHKGRNGDHTQLDMVATMIEDWKHELTHKGTAPVDFAALPALEVGGETLDRHLVALLCTMLKNPNALTAEEILRAMGSSTDTEHLQLGSSWLECLLEKGLVGYVGRVRHLVTLPTTRRWLLTEKALNLLSQGIKANRRT